MSGRNSVVECQLPKLDVAGSSPVARSNNIKGLVRVTNPFLFCRAHIGHTMTKKQLAWVSFILPERALQDRGGEVIGFMHHEMYGYIMPFFSS
jgi:hypothetical protein